GPPLRVASDQASSCQQLLYLFFAHRGNLRLEQSFDLECQLSDGRRIKERAQRQVHSEDASDLPNQLRSEQECPPNRKKLSFTLTASMPSNVESISASFDSSGVRGAVNSCSHNVLSASGAGKAPRSTFPF